MKKSFLMVGILVVLLVVSASVCAASDDIDYVGKDLELKDGEAGIISIEDGDAERDSSIPYLFGGAALLLVASGGVVLRLKKVK